MGIRVGTVVNIMKAWGTYQTRLKYYKDRLNEAEKNNDTKKISYWKDTISMTEAEIGEFMNVVV